MAKIIVEIERAGGTRVDADGITVVPFHTYEYDADRHGVDFDYEDGFVVVRAINDRGYLCNPVLYVPKDRVVSIKIIDEN